MASSYINSEQITSLANSLKSKGNNIYTEYKQNCSSAIQSSSDCLQLSGLDTSEFFKALETIYTKLDERVSQLADFLTNVVAAEYSVTSQAIINSFNNDFASQVAGILGISVTASTSVSNSTPSAQPTSTGSTSSSSQSTVSTPKQTAGSSTSKQTPGSTATKETPGNTSNQANSNTSKRTTSTTSSTEPKFVSNCSGLFKVVSTCSGGETLVNVTGQYKPIKNCSGQTTYIPTEKYVAPPTTQPATKIVMPSVNVPPAGYVREYFGSGGVRYVKRDN